MGAVPQCRCVARILETLIRWNGLLAFGVVFSQQRTWIVAVVLAVNAGVAVLVLTFAYVPTGRRGSHGAQPISKRKRRR